MNRESSKKIVSKPNMALILTPKIGGLTPLSRKIFNVLLQKSQTELLEMGVVDATGLNVAHTFSVPTAVLIDFCKQARSKDAQATDSPIKVIKKHLQELRRTEVVWESPEAKSGMIWADDSLLTYVGYDIRDGILFAVWKLSEDLVNGLAKSDAFTRIDIYQIAKLTHYTSICLYDICAKYRTNYNGRTCKNTPDWWVSKLSRSPISTDKPQRPWRKIKDEFVMDAIKEINDKTDLEIELLQEKIGKTVATVQFRVREKSINKEVTAINDNHLKLVNQSAKLGVDITPLLKTEKEINIEFALSKFEGRMLVDQSIGKIENRQAYFNKIVRETSNTVITTTPAPIPAPPTVVALDPDNIYTRMNKEFDSLPEAEKQRFARLVAEDKKISLTPKYRQKLNDGISNAFIQSYLTAKYATEKYGPGWNKDTSLNANQGEAK